MGLYLSIYLSIYLSCFVVFHLFRIEHIISIISFLFIIWIMINTSSTYNISSMYSLHSLHNNTRVTCSSALSGHRSSSLFLCAALCCFGFMLLWGQQGWLSGVIMVGWGETDRSTCCATLCCFMLLWGQRGWLSGIIMVGWGWDLQINMFCFCGVSTASVARTLPFVALPSLATVLARCGAGIHDFDKTIAPNLFQS